MKIPLSLQLDLTRFPPSHTSLYTQYFVKTNLTSIKSKLGQNLATDTNELQEQRT